MFFNLIYYPANMGVVCSDEYSTSLSHLNRNDYFDASLDVSNLDLKNYSNVGSFDETENSWYRNKRDLVWTSSFSHGLVSEVDQEIAEVRKKFEDASFNVHELEDDIKKAKEEKVSRKELSQLKKKLKDAKKTMKDYKKELKKLSLKKSK